MASEAAIYGRFGYGPASSWSTWKIDARRAEFAAAAAESGRKARKAAKKARKNAGKKHRDFEKAALATAATVKRTIGAEPEPRRRWPWVFAALALGTAAFVFLRRKQADDWTPAPASDGPVPSYREDPVPSSPSNSHKTVSAATTAPGDSTPAETDLGMQPQQLAEGSAGPVEDAPLSPSAEGGDEPRRGDAPEPFTSEGPGAAGPTAGPDDRQR